MIQDPDILEIKRGGGFFTIFGMLFLIIGLLTIISAFNVIPTQAHQPWHITAPFGVIFSIIGILMIFGRIGLIIDRRQRKIIRWYGAPVPVIQKDFALNHYKNVVINKEVVRKDRSTRIVYHVMLKGESGVKPIKATQCNDYNIVWKKAKEIARFLCLPVVDTSSGQEVIRNTDQLDESLRERVRQTGEQISILNPPKDMRTQVCIEDNRITLNIPPQGFKIKQYTLIGIGVLSSF
ncbi:MAG: hypothetical protein SVW57_14760, partial [Thermodesulfobacteriota bacterium]|nr:hypothetical protein [Thermodesulfobacteriota bacterium]